MRNLITFVLLSFSMIINAQMHLYTTSDKIINLNSYDIRGEQVKCMDVDNSVISISKKDIVYIKESQNKVITFLSGKKKVVLKEKNIDPTNLATLGRIDAYRFYKTQNKPIITNTEYVKSYNDQLNQLRRSGTVGIVAGGIALLLGVGILIVTLGAL